MTTTKRWLQRAGFIMGSLLLGWYATKNAGNREPAPDPAALSQPADSSAGKPSSRLTREQIADLHARLREAYGQTTSYQDEHRPVLAQINEALEARWPDIDRLAREYHQQEGCARFETIIDDRMELGLKLPTWQETLDGLFWNVDYNLDSSRWFFHSPEDVEEIMTDPLRATAFPFPFSLAHKVAMALHQERCIGESVNGAVEAYQQHLAQQGAGACDDAVATMQQIGDARRMLTTTLYCSGTTQDSGGRLLASADARQRFYDQLRSLTAEEVAVSAGLIPLYPEPEYDQWRSVCEAVYQRDGMAPSSAAASCLGDIIIADPGRHEALTPARELGFSADELKSLARAIPAVDYERRCALLAAAQEELFDRIMEVPGVYERIVSSRGVGVVPANFYMDCLAGNLDNAL